MDRSSKQKINKETQILHDTLDEMDLIDIFRTLHPNAEYTFFSSAHGIFSRREHMLGHKRKKKKIPKVGNKRQMMGDIKESQEIQHSTIRLVQK